MNLSKYTKDFERAKTELERACRQITDLLTRIEAEGADPTASPPTKTHSNEGSYNCPLCSAVMRKRNGYKGEFWGCTNYPDCRGTRNEDGTPTIKRSSYNEETTPFD
jgi:hypothetical protein